MNKQRIFIYPPIWMLDIVRLVMNDYMADILYYFNPHFGSQIVQMIVEELNEAYDTFMEKHPDFNGKISVYALSLGGVAMFDILTCQDDDEPEDLSQSATASTSTSDQQDGTTTQTTGAEEVQEPPAKKARVRKQDQSKFRAVIPKLKFRPEYLFTVGSPVGTYTTTLILTGLKPYIFWHIIDCPYFFFLN